VVGSARQPYAVCHQYSVAWGLAPRNDEAALIISPTALGEKAEN